MFSHNFKKSPKYATLANISSCWGNMWVFHHSPHGRHSFVEYSSFSKVCPPPWTPNFGCIPSLQLCLNAGVEHIFGFFNFHIHSKNDGICPKWLHHQYPIDVPQFFVSVVSQQKLSTPWNFPSTTLWTSTCTSTPFTKYLALLMNIFTIGQYTFKCTIFTTLIFLPLPIVGKCCLMFVTLITLMKFIWYKLPSQNAITTTYYQYLSQCICLDWIAFSILWKKLVHWEKICLQFWTHKKILLMQILLVLHGSNFGWMLHFSFGFTFH